MTAGSERAEVTQLIFNTNDSAMAVSGSNGYIGRWSLPTYELIHETPKETSTQEPPLSYQSIDFMHD
jgi:hypothetical protein